MRSALALHDVLVHGAIGRHGGYLVKSTGDGVFAVFGSAQDGLAAAVGSKAHYATATTRALVFAHPLRLRVRAPAASRRIGSSGSV